MGLFESLVYLSIRNPMFKNQLKLIFSLMAIFCWIIYVNNKNETNGDMIGIFWGAFDPPTEAHQEIIRVSLQKIPLKKLFVVVNNNQYKKYTYSLSDRLKLMKQIIAANNLKNVELLWQDDTHKLNYVAFKQFTHDPICAIAGYDSYRTWVKYSNPQERVLYDAIAVIPRGDEPPLLFDQNAFLLPIDSTYRYISSTKVREGLQTYTPSSSK